MGLARCKVCWILLFAGTLSLAAFGQQPSLTLREAIDRALGENPQAAIAKADEDNAAAQISLARSALLPRLNFAEDISRGNDPVYAFGTRLRQQRFMQSDFALNALNRPSPIGNFATRFNGQWMLFNWSETNQQIHAARLGAASAHSAFDAVDQAIVLRVVETYQAVLYAQRRIDLTRHQQQTAEALLHDAQTRVKAGLALDSDLMSAQVNLSARQQEAISAEGQLQNAWAELEAAIGGPVTPRPELQPIEPKTFPEGVLAGDIAAALKARPDLKALDHLTAARQQAVKAARADFLPQISAYGNWEMDRVTFAGDGGNNWVAGAQLTFDILPLGKHARLQQATAERQKAEAQQRSAEQQIRLAVQRAYSDHQTAERMMATARASMDQSTESLRILRNRYSAGLATITDFLRAEDAQRQAQNDYWRAAYGNTAAYAGLLYATGQLTPDTAEKLQ